jgi:hypothetical protein
MRGQRVLKLDRFSGLAARSDRNLSCHDNLYLETLSDVMKSKSQ